MAKRTGMGGVVTVATVEYPVGEWAVTATNDVQDTTDTGSDGWMDNCEGVSSAECSFKAFWGSAAGSLASAFEIGTVVSADFGIGGGGSVSGDFRIKSFTITNNAKTPIEFSCTGTSKGEVTFA